MLSLIKPYVGPAAILAIDIGAGMTGWWSGLLLGLGGFWLLIALFSHRALLKRFPWLPTWAPFLDPTGAFATSDQLTSKFISGHSFRISEIAKDSVISSRTFDDCEIFGPAVISLSGICQLVSCTFTSAPEVMVIRVTQDQVVGIIKLQDCNFKNCKFHNIAFIGRQDLLEKVIAAETDNKAKT